LTDPVGRELLVAGVPSDDADLRRHIDAVGGSARRDPTRAAGRGGTPAASACRRTGCCPDGAAAAAPARAGFPLPRPSPAVGSSGEKGVLRSRVVH